MKKILIPALVCFVGQAQAADRIVEEFGVSPTYPNIAAAVTAASNGDRIIIKNRAGDIPWIENITVDKSLQFLSYANDGPFVVQGTYTIPSVDGREVTIIGMRNTAGGIAGSAGGTSTRGTKVRIIDSYFVNGSVVLNLNAFDVDVVSSTFLNGTVSISFGNVIGNNIDGTNLSDEGISVNTTGTGAAVDTCAIVGNKVRSKVGYEGIWAYSFGQVFHIRNNYIQHGWMGIEVAEGPTGTANLIWNNTITAYTGNFTSYGIDLANTNPGSIWEVMNNVVTKTWSGDNRGINDDSGNQGQINVYFNHVSSLLNFPISPTFTFVGNNTTTSSISLNPDGTLVGGELAIDGGNPAVPFYDLDLTIGDAGAYGGSYTLTNFHPLHTGAARVYMAAHPFNVRQGTTLRVKASAFDR